MSTESTSSPQQQPPAWEMHPTFMEAVAKANDAIIEMLILAGKLYKQNNCQLVGTWVGLDDDALEELSKYRKADLIRASRIGPCISVPRFSDAESIRAVLSNGFSHPAMLAALTKTMPLKFIEKKKPRRVA